MLSLVSLVWRWKNCCNTGGDSFFSSMVSLNENECKFGRFTLVKVVILKLLHFDIFNLVNDWQWVNRQMLGGMSIVQFSMVNLVVRLNISLSSRTLDGSIWNWCSRKETKFWLQCVSINSIIFRRFTDVELYMDTRRSEIRPPKYDKHFLNVWHWPFSGPIWKHRCWARNAADATSRKRVHVSAADNKSSTDSRSNIRQRQSSLSSISCIPATLQHIEVACGWASTCVVLLAASCAAELAAITFKSLPNIWCDLKDKARLASAANLYMTVPCANFPLFGAYSIVASSIEPNTLKWDERCCKRTYDKHIDEIVNCIVYGVFIDGCGRLTCGANRYTFNTRIGTFALVRRIWNASLVTGNGSCDFLQNDILSFACYYATILLLHLWVHSVRSLDTTSYYKWTGYWVSQHWPTINNRIVKISIYPSTNVSLRQLGMFWLVVL